MKLLNKLIFSILAISMSSVIMANECEIPICIVVDEGFANLPAEAGSMLETQLQRIAIQANASTGWNNSNFALTAKFDQINRYVVDGAPAQIVNVFGVTLYIADVYHRKNFVSTYIEIKGVGKNETKAAIDAIRSMNAQNSQIKQFIENSKQKIINYYDTQIPTLIKDANVKSSMKKYDEALATLAVIPTCCSGYDVAMKEALKIYALYRDDYCLTQLNKAKALWASNPTVEGSREVAEILAAIDPDAKCYSEAMKLLTSVSKNVKSDIDYETKKKYEDAVKLEQMRIQAIKAIGMAYASNQPKAEILFLGRPLPVY